MSDGFPPILVAEDDAASKVLVRTYFQHMRLANPPFFAGSTKEAIAFLSRVVRGEEALPALALLDLHLPDGTGLDVIRWMRQRDALVNVPIIMLTGSSESIDIDEAYSLGVASYLVKPVGFDALADLLRTLPLPWALTASVTGS